MQLTHSNFILKTLRLFGSFSIVGLITTLISMGLLFVFYEYYQTPLIITYILIYIITILLSFLLNSFFVFKTKLSFRNSVVYVGVYGSGMIIGSLLLWLFKNLLPFDNWIISYLTLPFTFIWNFFLAYKFLK